MGVVRMSKYEIIQKIEDGNWNLYNKEIISKTLYDINQKFIDTLLDDVINSRQNLNEVV